MSEFGTSPETAAREEETSAERHEKTAREVVDRLVEAGYFHPGEKAEIVLPESGSDAKWSVRCLVSVYDTARREVPHDPDRKTKFPTVDPLKDGFIAAGYRVSICPGDESEDPSMCTAEYYLYATEG